MENNLYYIEIFDHMYADVIDIKCKIYYKGEFIIATCYNHDIDIYKKELCILESLLMWINDDEYANRMFDILLTCGCLSGIFTFPLGRHVFDLMHDHLINKNVNNIEEIIIELNNSSFDQLQNDLHDMNNNCIIKHYDCDYTRTIKKIMKEMLEKKRAERNAQILKYGAVACSLLLIYGYITNFS